MAHMDKNIENEMVPASPLKEYVGIYKDITPAMEHRMERNMQHEMDTGDIWGVVVITASETGLLFWNQGSLLLGR